MRTSLVALVLVAGSALLLQAAGLPNLVAAAIGGSVVGIGFGLRERRRGADRTSGRPRD